MPFLMFESLANENCLRGRRRGRSPSRAEARLRYLDIARRRRKKVLMSHKISIFQLIPIVENLIPAGTRGVAFLRSLREVKFCQNQAKNIDISPFFSTLARKRKISAEESPQEILDGKSIARATSCFVANAENITRSHKTASPLVRYVIKNCSCERATRVFS